MERPGALAPGQIDRRAGRPRHELERSESEWSGRPASNRLPQPWEGCALPGELRPLVRLQILGVHVFSTTPSDSGAASATTERTSAEYSSTSAAERTGSSVDAMMWYSGRSASGTTSTQPPSTNTFTPSVRSTRSLRCFAARSTAPGVIFVGTKRLFIWSAIIEKASDDEAGPSSRPGLAASAS